MLIGGEEDRGFFFKNDLSRRRSAFSLRNRSNSARSSTSRTRLAPAAEGLARNTHRPSNCALTPISAATCTTGRPVSATSRTASARNSGVYLLRVPAMRTSSRATTVTRSMSTRTGQPTLDQVQAERFNRTLLNEWAYVQAWTCSWLRHQGLDRFLDHHNTRRGHSALGGRPPTSRLPVRLQRVRSRQLGRVSNVAVVGVRLFGS